MRLNPFRRRKKGRRGRSQSNTGWLKPETRQAVVGVLLIVFAIIVVLSFFSAAGPTGRALLLGLRRLFGFVTYIIPFIVLAWGVYLVRPHEEPIGRLRIVAIGLTVIGLLGIFHSVGVAAEDSLQVAWEGKGGGVTGFALVFPLDRAFGSIASVLIFIATFFVGLFLVLNTTPVQLWRYLTGLFVPGRGDEEEEDEDDYADDEEEDASSVPAFRISRMGGGKPDPNQLKLEEEQRAAEEEQKRRVNQQLQTANKKYQPPRLELLHSSIGQPDSGNIEDNKEKIRSTLEKFGIDVKMKKVNVGPTVAQYTLVPEQGVKLARITALQNDLALALAAHPLRIEAPIPNTNLVGIEIPNKEVSLVRLRDIIASREFRKHPSPLGIALGKDVSGKPRVATLENMPHLLIAGATGSGKSIFINTLLVSLLYRNSPALVRFIMVDPKRVELSLYNGIPHLLTPVITEPDKTINALKWAVREMDRRYRLLSESGARNLMSYNANNPDEALPMIVIVIDELADLMATHARDVEGIIVRLAQMARAIGIHLVLATQRPSVNVITGLIKANVPARVAFNVASQVDSRTILDSAGAEKLLGSGDMLYLPGDQAKPFRIQGGYISEEEVRSVVKDIVEENDIDPEYEDEIVSPNRESVAASGEEANDPMFQEARDLVMQSGKASASLLQRRLRVGYSRAARILDMLEDQGVIGPQEGNKPREILVSDEGQYDSQEDDQGGYGEEEEY